MIKIGRNDPCWCGSGRKYKSCHLSFDETVADFKRKGAIVPSRKMIKTDAQMEGIRKSAAVNIAVLDFVAERIRAAFASGCVLPNKRPITGSFGVAQFPDNGDYMKFYHQLDHALYQAKQNGKNCVCLAEEPPKNE